MNALVLAEKKTAAVAGEAETQQYLTFTLGGEMYAIEIDNIKEIIEYGSLTTVPMMPEFVRGVINLRGRVVPVIDLSVRFGRKATETTKRTCNVIVEVQTEEQTLDLGIVVDAVSEVLEIPASEIEPAPAFGAKIRADFIQGMGKVNGEFVIILGLDKVLSVEKMAILTGQSQRRLPSLIAAKHRKINEQECAFLGKGAIGKPPNLEMSRAKMP